MRNYTIPPDKGSESAWLHCLSGQQTYRALAKRYQAERIYHPLLLVAFLLFGLPLPSHAATYYVDDSATPGATCAQAQNQATPRKTLALGAACLSGGDTLIVRAGVYTETLRNRPSRTKVYPSGLNNSQHTIIKGFTGERPVIQPSSSGIPVVQGHNTTNITLENLEFDLANCPSCSVTGGNNFTNLTIRNVFIRNLTVAADTPGGGGCMICSWGKADTGWVIEDNVLSGFTITGTYRRLIHAMYLHGDNAIVRRNKIFMAGQGGYVMHFYGGSTTVAPNNVLVEQNWIEGGGTGGFYTKGTDNTLINNVIYDNGWHPFQSQPKGITVSSTATGFTAYHNTIYSNAGCFDINSTKNVSIRNNICFANATNTITGAGSGSTTTPNFFSNPLFVAAPPNLDLQSTSTARSGSANVGVTTDYAGVTREAPADFGAFEFETAAPPSTTHYIKPNGNDAADGSSEANAWKTFGHALPLLQPGHTLIVMDGTYTKAINGVPRLDCTSTTVNGTASQPITVQAQNERQAHITSDGTVNPLNIRFCSYWTFEGLYLQHADNTTQESLNSGDVVFVRQSDRLTFRRLLLQHPNATAPTGHDGFHVELSTDCLIEENELYDMAQHGFLLDGHSTMPLERNVLRRNYLHARQAGAQTGIGIALTEAKRNIIENNIIEGFGTGIEQYYGPGAVQNRYLGNVVLSSGKTRVGLRLTSDAQASNGPAVTGVDQMPQTTEITHLSVLGASTTGVQLTSTKNTTLRNITLLDGGGNGLVVDLHSDPAARGDGAPSVSGANLMIANNAGTGIVLDTTTSVDLQYVWAFGNGTAASPALTDGRYSHTFTTDPLLSACFVGIPNGSGACLAGSLGESIGAHIATRYADGTLTPSVLWDASTHEFPCGAVLTGGINDGGGQSCTDVHTRLHVSAGGCTFESPAACLNTSPPPLRHHGRGHYETSTVFGFPY